jgi:hypothetical protein
MLNIVLGNVKQHIKKIIVVLLEIVLIVIILSMRKETQRIEFCVPENVCMNIEKMDPILIVHIVT